MTKLYQGSRWRLGGLIFMNLLCPLGAVGIEFGTGHVLMMTFLLGFVGCGWIYAIYMLCKARYHNLDHNGEEIKTPVPAQGPAGAPPRQTPAAQPNQASATGTRHSTPAPPPYDDEKHPRVEESSMGASADALNRPGNAQSHTEEQTSGSQQPPVQEHNTAEPQEHNTAEPQVHNVAFAAQEDTTAEPVQHSAGKIQRAEEA